MAEAEVPDRSAGVGRLGMAAAWISAVCCLPYLVLKVLWTLGVPVGVTDRSVLDSNDWVAANALMAVIQLAGLLLVLALTRPWARRVPTWLLLFPVWVGTGLLFQVVVGAVLVGASSSSSQGSNASTGEFQPWVFAMIYASFAGQGAALAIAFACHVRTRWGRVLGERTGETVARRTGRVRSWPEHHLTGMIEAVAGMAAAMAVVCGYWAAGGSYGSGALPDPPWGLQASRVAGAVTAVVGLLGLTGRWGHRIRFWLPAALTWVGSGAMAAFDGLALMAFLLLGTGASEPGWGQTDTVLLIKVVIGLLAGAVGALAITVAAKDDHRQRGSPEGVEVRRVEVAATGSRRTAEPSVPARGDSSR
ncbi:MAG TPA: hypothetical protein VFQ15_00755 [Jiangellaceae bacterium]|nr:hypothetical protein [Jiangellaceae bacterium]